MLGEEERVGTRVAAVRKQRGWTGQRLASEAHLSYSLLSKVETGALPATPAFLAAVAKALGVEKTALTGQPYRGESRREDRAHQAIPALRRELAAYDLPPDTELPPPNLDELRTRVRAATQLRQQSGYVKLAQTLPDLLTDLRHAAHVASGPQREQVYALLAEVYDDARQLSYKLGYGDLAAVIVDRHAWAAQRAGDVLEGCVGSTMRAAELIGVGEWNAAHRVLDQARAHIEPSLRRAGPPTLSVWGYLHLESGLAAARAGDETRTRDHLNEADVSANRIGRNRDDYRLAFGPTNVGIWSVALAVELGQAEHAIHNAGRVQLPARFSAERSSHYYIDLSRAQLWKGDRNACLASLQQARTLAPQHTRNHPMVRETVHALRRLERQANDTIRGFAAWMGLE